MNVSLIVTVTVSLGFRGGQSLELTTTGGRRVIDAAFGEVTLATGVVPLVLDSAAMMGREEQPVDRIRKRYVDPTRITQQAIEHLVGGAGGA